MKNILTILSVAALAAPTAALAQTHGQINLQAEVEPACVLSITGDTDLDLDVLTGPDGRLRPDLAGSAVAASTTLDAWCNMPNTLTLTAVAMEMADPGYGSPAGFSRELAYDASLDGWRAGVIYRAGIDATDAESSGDAYAADPLTLEISNLIPLTGSGQDSAAFLEAGVYTGLVTITLGAQ